MKLTAGYDLASSSCIGELINPFVKVLSFLYGRGLIIILKV